MKSMKAQFGSIGITLTLSPPGQHAQRSERYTQTLKERLRSTLDSLSYELPNELLMYLYIAVAHSMNLIHNSRSFPLSPYEKVHNRRCVFHQNFHFRPLALSAWFRWVIVSVQLWPLPWPTLSMPSVKLKLGYYWALIRHFLEHICFILTPQDL